MTLPYACARCRERLPWYAAGSLPLGERAEVEEHLANCDACRREVALWRAVGSALDGMDEVAPEPPAALEDVTWRGVQSRIAAYGWASRSGLKERFLMDDETTPAATALAQRATAGPSRRQPFVALAAAVLIIAVSATLLGVYGARLRVGGSSTTTAATACAPGQIKAHLPAHAELRDISMVSATDGWAVGEVWNSSVSGSTLRTIIMRYQHCVWSETGKSIPSAELLNVAMTSASDGWAFGLKTVDAWETEQALLLHYTSGTWQRVHLNSIPNVSGGVLRMFSKDDGWLILENGGDTGDIGLLSTIYHYQGSQWTPVALPARLSAASISVAATRSPAPDEVWLSGTLARTSDSFIARYSAGQWQVWDTSMSGGLNPEGSARSFVSARGFFSTIQVISPHDVWAFGTYRTSPDVENAPPYILHFDGARWAPVSLVSPGGSLPTIVLWTAAVPQPDGGFLALGMTGTFLIQRVVALHCSAQSCQPRTFPITSVSMVDSVSLSTPTQGFAVAFPPAGHLAESLPPTSILLAYNAGAWTRVPA